MKILVAPDKFKGVVTAREAAENMAAGLREELPAAEIDIQPVADGGEGTAEILCAVSGGVWRTVGAHDAAGEPCQARYCWIAGDKRAVFEMSEVAGLKAVSKTWDLEQGTTRGVGDIIAAALRNGAETILVGLGGSMTNDGGFGMARALGYRFLDGEGRNLSGGVADLLNLDRIMKPDGGSPAARIFAAADVKNPLLGPNGATQVFAAQKGASPAQIVQLEKALTKLADVAEQDFDVSVRDRAGAGAAGGLGFGLVAFCGAEIRSGFQLVAEAVELERRVAKADLVVTGEGSLDRQTLEGKAPGQIAAMAAKLARPVYAIVGRADNDGRLREAFDGIFEVARTDRVDPELIRRAPELLRMGGRKLGALLAAESAKNHSERPPGRAV